MTKEFWDFDENINYKIVNIQDNNFKISNNYKVINNYPDYYTAAFILNTIHKYIILICKYFQVNFYKYSKNDQLYINCFLDIHPNKYLLSEMQLGTEFYGLNKPRELYLSNKPRLGKDGKYRANFRHIFITLRNSNGKFNNFDIIMDLVIHEIAHTMCNHIRWRNDDHGTDFKHAEKLIKNAYKKIN
jgi:hypothetical protein